MYSRILVAVDGSDSSLHALRKAIELAKGLSATLRVIHVVEMGWLPVGIDPGVDVEAMTAARRKAAETVMSTVREIVQASGYEAETAVLETQTPAQHVVVAIMDEISRWAAKLLVIGTHGRRGFKSLLLGSVAEQMTRLAPIPLLLIPVPQG